MRVLVVYASSRGGTEGLARMVAESLVAHGLQADIGDASSVDELEGYEAIIVGGALYNGKWHPDATWFVDRHFLTLRETNVWFFSSGPLDDSARSGALAPVPQVQELARQADIRGHMTFGGVLEPKSKGFLSSLLSWAKPGDFRDPKHVAEWVEMIVARLAEPRMVITLPDVDTASGGVASRMLRRLVAAGEGPDDGTDDLGLDVLLD